jgi:hypothetical protein
MDPFEKALRLETLELALQDLDRIISAMKNQDYPQEEVNEYVKQRWGVWNEMHKVNKS